MSDYIVTPEGVINPAAIAFVEPTGDGRLTLTTLTGYKIIVPDPDGNVWRQLTSNPYAPTPPTVCKTSTSTPPSSRKATSLKTS